MKEIHPIPLPKHISIFVLLAIAMVSLSGCRSAFPIRTYFIQTAQLEGLTSNAQEVSIHTMGEPTIDHFFVLGKVMAYRRGGLGAVRDLDEVRVPPREMVQQLIKPAKALGADMVIGVYDGEYRGVNVAGEYVSGLAGKLTTSAKNERVDFRVGILPVQVGMAKLSQKQYALLDRDLRAGARWFLENKGYYAPIDPSIKFQGTTQDLLSQLSSQNPDIGDKQAELLLLLEVVEEKAAVAALLDVRKVVLRATLYSRSLKKVLWDNKISQENVTGVFWIWMSKAVSRAGAIEKLLYPLPFFFRPAGSEEFSSCSPDMAKKKIK